MWKIPSSLVSLQESSDIIARNAEELAIIDYREIRSCIIHEIFHKYEK